jgi:hypothetical protein
MNLAIHASFRAGRAAGLLVLEACPYAPAWSSVE